MYDDTSPEICEPSRVDKDMVNIFIEKIDVPPKSHSNQNDTLNEILTSYTKIKALDDPRTIHFHQRKKIQQTQYNSSKQQHTQYSTNKEQQTQYNNNKQQQRQYNNNKPQQKQ